MVTHSKENQPIAVLLIIGCEGNICSCKVVCQSFNERHNNLFDFTQQNSVHIYWKCECCTFD